MGVAIIFIMATHSLGRFALFGNIGVEWFLIVSAIGQYFSLSKDYNIWHYYKKRAKRILPAYFIVAVPFFLIRFPFSIHNFIINITGLNLVVWGLRVFWFVSLIVICYLITPLYYKIVNKYRYSILIPFILVAITFVVSFHIPKTQILVTRIPIYLLGLHLGKCVYEERVISGKTECLLCYIISFFSMLSVVLINYVGVGVEVQRLVYFFCGIPSLFLILSFFKLLPFTHAILSFIGKVSYEIYLLHESIVLTICLLLPLPKLICVLISYVFAVLFAYLLHSAIALFIKS